MYKIGKRAYVFTKGDYLVTCVDMTSLKDATIFQIDSITPDLYLHLKVVQTKLGGVFDGLLHDGTSIRIDPHSVVFHYAYREEDNFENILKL